MLPSLPPRPRGTPTTKTDATPLRSPPRLASAPTLAVWRSPGGSGAFGSPFSIVVFFFQLAFRKGRLRFFAGVADAALPSAAAGGALLTSACACGASWVLAAAATTASLCRRGWNVAAAAAARSGADDDAGAAAAAAATVRADREAYVATITEAGRCTCGATAALAWAGAAPPLAG